MKVTALIPDELIQELKKQTKSKTITDGLIQAITEWVSISKIRALNQRVSESPLIFNKQYSAYQVRSLNRRG